MNGSNATVSGFNTTFTLDLKVGDFVTVPGAGAGGADLTARVNAIASNTSLTLASNSATAVTSVQIIRLRNSLRGFSGDGTNSLTITNAAVLGNGAKVKVTATITRTLSVEKTKTNQPCHLVLVDADNANGVEYGTASTHKEISLGRADHYKL